MKVLKTNAKKGIAAGVGLVMVFILFTVMVMTVDVRPKGQNGTDIGFASVNLWFHQMTGNHLLIYTITDWLGLVPIAICMCYGVLGLTQWIRRKNLFKVDSDILLLGVYYILVIMGYLIFEMIPINYRPIPIDGYMEASYPSSTTLLVLSVMPTLVFQTNRRARSANAKRLALVFAVLFSAFMVGGRLIAGVHWLTDIIGSILLSAGLYLIYRFAVIQIDQNTKEKNNEDSGTQRKSQKG